MLFDKILIMSKDLSLIEKQKCPGYNCLQYRIRNVKGILPELCFDCTTAFENRNKEIDR